MTNMKTGSANTRVRFASKERMLECGVNEHTADILCKSPSRNTIAAWYMGSNPCKPLHMAPDGKSVYTDKLQRLAMTLASDARGASRKTVLKLEAGIAIKMDVTVWDSDENGNATKRQSFSEWQQWDIATDEQRLLLADIFFVSMGKDGKRSDFIKMGNGKTARVGQYILTVMPLATCVDSADWSDISALRNELNNKGLVSWDCRSANMGKVNGKWVLIDYGVE